VWSGARKDSRVRVCKVSAARYFKFKLVPGITGVIENKKKVRPTTETCEGKVKLFLA